MKKLIALLVLASCAMWACSDTGDDDLNTNPEIGEVQQGLTQTYGVKTPRTK